ncbi:MAG: DEAD/DEAH box helicase family protein, partial [Nitrospina sp.]|nr:DEAD/DEAH box helicase family protein [Nitrospina sp.]
MRYRKDFIAYWLADKLKAKNIVVAVPSLNLIRQCLRTWAIESTADKKKVNWIAVCSDQKVKDLNKDDFQVLVKDLGIRAHTKVNEITGWLKKKKVGKNIVFTTYDSGPNLAKASKKAKFKFDVGIFDEAHHTAGGKDSQSSTLLFNKNINISKRVFLTATERRYRGSSDDIISMDDPLIYGGEPCHYLSFKKALEYNNPPILTDYEIRAIYTPKKEILDLIRKNILVRPKTGKWNSVIEARVLSSLSILNKTLRDIKFKHCISYHNTIDRADAFADSQGEFTKFLKLKTIKTFHVSSRITISARERLIKNFENITPSLVTNSRCLSEGVDIPKVDSILFCDPRESRIDVVQAMGRALRVEKNKKKSYIMIPAMVDEEGVIDDKDFQTIVNAVSAIGSSDDQLIDWFESVCKGSKSKGGKVKFIVPKGTKVDYQKITESLQIKIYDRLKRITKKRL